MRYRSIAPLIFLAIATHANGNSAMAVGDGRIDGTRVRPYELSWRQCAIQDGRWHDLGEFSESLSVIGDQVIRHRQVSRQPNGVVNRADTFFDRASFAPLFMEMEATKDGVRTAYSERRLSTDGYSGFSVKSGKRRSLIGAISSGMLHGAAMGLPLSTMDYQDEPVEFVASMIGFDATYDVIAEWVGRETLHVDGRDIEAWLIDVEWHHRESVDVYPSGPDASGGRYWVVADPPEGVPYVPRYRTDTYIVDFAAADPD